MEEAERVKLAREASELNVDNIITSSTSNNRFIHLSILLFHHLSIVHAFSTFELPFSGRCRNDFKLGQPLHSPKVSKPRATEDGSDGDDDDQPLKSGLSNLRDIIESESD